MLLVMTLSFDCIEWQPRWQIYPLLLNAFKWAKHICVFDPAKKNACQKRSVLKFDLTCTWSWSEILDLRALTLYNMWSRLWRQQKRDKGKEYRQQTIVSNLFSYWIFLLQWKEQVNFSQIRNSKNCWIRFKRVIF